MRERLTQLGLYSIMGVLSTAIDISAYVLITRILSAEGSVSVKAVTFLIGSVSSLYLNRTYTFRMASPLSMREIARFYVMAGASLCVNASMFYVFSRIVGVYDVWSAFIALCFSFATGFAISRSWVFKNRAMTPVV